MRTSNYRLMEEPKGGIVVLSLFDGISCGQIALERAGVKVSSYFASEINVNAIKVTQSNYPHTKQIGDVTKVRGAELPKIDLLIGGSPCQGFSCAGNRLNFNDPRSFLFFEFSRLLQECCPKYFLLENVKMGKESADVITDILGVQPIIINSALVSAQNRTRLYWTNISNVKQPKNKGIALKDVFETDITVLKKYKVNKTPSRIKMWEGKCKNITNEDKSNCVVTRQDRWNSQGLVEFEDFCRYLTPIENERLQTIPDNYTKIDGVSDNQRDFMIGNSWTVDVVAHIFSYMDVEFTHELYRIPQLSPAYFIFEGAV